MRCVSAITLLLQLILPSLHAQLPGDFSQDGIYDCNDIDALTTEIATGGMNLSFDLDGDGEVSQTDTTRWLEVAGDANIGAPYLYGDINLDGSIRPNDITGEWNGNRFTFNSQWCKGDVNGDGAVDIVDGLMIQNNFLLTSSTDVGTGAGPDPIPSELGRFIYDPDDGRIYLAAESDISGWVITGPETERLLDFDGFDNNLVWSSRYFNGKHQSLGLRVSGANGAVGNYLFAEYPEGLTQSDFGEVIYGTDRFIIERDGLLSTSVEIRDVIPGDANLDGVVEVADFNLWNAHKFGDGEIYWGKGDFNGDGLVDVSDFNIWNGNKFTGSEWNLSAVPETAGHLWLCWALVLLFPRLRQRPE